MKKLVVMLFVCCCILTGCGKDKKKTEETVVGIAKTDQVQVESIIAKDHKLVLKITNEDNRLVDLYDVDVAFYREDEFLKTGEAFLKNIDASSTGYVALELPKDEKGNTIEATKIDVKVHKTVYEKSNVESYTGQVKGTVSKDKEDEHKLIVSLENTSKQVLNEVEVVLVFQKDDKIVSLLSTYLLNVKEKTETTFYVPTIVKGETASYIDYDKIDVVINHASKNK